MSNIETDIEPQDESNEVDLDNEDVVADTYPVDEVDVEIDKSTGNEVDVDITDTELIEDPVSDEDETLADSTDARNDKPKSPYDKPGKWYVLHTQSGHENKVRDNILTRAQSMNIENRLYEVVIPLEDVVEFKNNKKVVVQKKVFPGYLLCRMRLDDDSWFVVRNTPGVTGFVGAGNKPSPLPRKEVETFLTEKADIDDESKKSRPRLDFEMNETVRVKEGPFADFEGQIVEINEDQMKVKVLVNIFGRETPVELEFTQVAKV